jgi:tRNA(Ile)-lysidine synthetase-like protein
MVDAIAKTLALDAHETRRFLVSVSGGLDSTVLLFCLNELRKRFPIHLEALHLNYKLRGRDSDGDEKWVKTCGAKWDIVVHSRVAKIDRKRAIQESARVARLSAQREFENFEIVEAHHADDQVETFFLRLLRGAGLHGLRGMEIKSSRDVQIVWRPLLNFSKEDLRAFVKQHKLRWREDKSNRTQKYDRNWVRNRLLPLCETRYPAARKSVLRVMEQIRETYQTPAINDHEIVTENGWRWAVLQGLSKIELENWIHRYFREKCALFLSRAQILELSQKIRYGKAFSFNAPRDLILRGRPKSRTVKESQVLFVRKRR